MPGKPRKMTKISVAETSGVDHPAHLHEGWMIRKSADKDTINKLFGLPDNTTEEGAKMAENEEVNKATVPELEAEIKELKATIAELKKSADAGASAEEVAKAAEAARLEELAKSKELPAEVREMLAKQAAEVQTTREELAKQREAFEKAEAVRADERAVAKSRATYTALGIDHEATAPALRRLPEELAKSIETVLKAADTQLAEAGVFSEIGKTAGGDNGAEAKLNAIATELVEKGAEKSLPVAFAKAVEANPALYTEYLAEKAGK